MGGIGANLIEMQIEAMRECVEFWHELTGGELYWITPYQPTFDIFERMRIANESGAMFRG